MIDVVFGGISATILVYILAEIAKKAGLDNDFVPIYSIISAISVVCLGTWSISVGNIFVGIIIGATTSGLYDNISKAGKIANGEK